MNISHVADSLEPYLEVHFEFQFSLLWEKYQHEFCWQSIQSQLTYKEKP